MQDGSLFSISSPAFIVCRIFDDGHSDWCEIISHCSFNLHFSNNEQGWAFHVFIGHLYVVNGKCLSGSSAQYLIGLFVFLMLSYMSCLYILEVNLLSVALFAIIFFNFEGCLFTSFIVSFAVGKVLSFSSVQFSPSVMSNSLQPHELQRARPHCPSPIPRVPSNSCPSSQWCLVDFCFYFHYSRRWVKEDISAIYIKECSMFSSKRFTVSGLQSWIWLKVNSCYLGVYVPTRNKNMFSRGRVYHSGEEISLQTIMQVDVWSIIKTKQAHEGRKENNNENQQKQEMVRKEA